MSSSTTEVLEDAARAFGRVLQHGAGLGQDLLRSMLPASMRTRCACGRHDCACEIPAPCWMPKHLCDVTSIGCAGGVATVRLRITNCGPALRHVRVQAVGKYGGLKIQPEEFDLGPYQREYVAVSLSLSPGAAKGEESEIVLAVRGCHDHVLRWTVKVGAFETCSSRTVEVEDCPDLLHHWYDHFYCARAYADGR